MPSTQLKNILEKNHIKFKCIDHPLAYTSQEIAQLAHIKGKEFAKTVIVKLDGKLAMIVMPSDEKLDLSLLKKLTKAKSIELANEFEFEKQFPDCETGAQPPFGNLYGMDVFVSKTLTEDKIIWFNAGTHSELIQMSFDDFAKLVRPKILELH